MQARKAAVKNKLMHEICRDREKSICKRSLTLRHERLRQPMVKKHSATYSKATKAAASRKDHPRL